MRFFIFIALFLAATALPHVAHAQESSFETESQKLSQKESKRRAIFKSFQTKPEDIHFGTDRSFISGPKYKAMTRDAVKNRPDDFDFTRFREHYVFTTDYDPMGEDTKSQLVKYAYTLQTSDSERDIKDAEDDYSRLILKHLANIEIVVLATSLAKTDKRLGDYTFFQWLSQGLMASVFQFGDGNTLDHAYVIITPLEETLLLKHKKLLSKNIEMIPTPSYYYNIHTAQNMITGQEQDFFVNVTYPLAKLKILEKNKAADINVTRQ
jgi:hypothetical protein